MEGRQHIQISGWSESRAQKILPFELGAPKTSLVTLIQVQPFS